MSTPTTTLLLPFAVHSRLELMEITDLITEHFIFIRDLNMCIPNTYITEIFKVPSIHNQLDQLDQPLFFSVTNELSEEKRTKYIAKITIKAGDKSSKVLEEYTIKIPVDIRRSVRKGNKKKELLSFMMRFTDVISTFAIPTSHGVYTISMRREGKTEGYRFFGGMLSALNIIHEIARI